MHPEVILSLRSVITMATLEAPQPPDSSSDGWCLGWSKFARGFVSMSAPHSALGLPFTLYIKEVCFSQLLQQSSRFIFP